MTVEGELDDISGSGQTRAAQDLCSGVPANERQHLEVEGAGHYGIFSGRRWRDIVYPQLVKFIANHAPQARAKPAAKPAAKPSVKPAAKATVKTTAKSASSAQNKAAGKKPLKVTAKVAPKAAIKTTWVSAKKKA
jgi:poly(3-hydroxybutyrate) depolymerase